MKHMILSVEMKGGFISYIIGGVAGFLNQIVDFGGPKWHIYSWLYWRGGGGVTDLGNFPKFYQSFCRLPWKQNSISKLIWYTFNNEAIADLAVSQS